jgi:hypothetical protein
MFGFRMLFELGALALAIVLVVSVVVRRRRRRRADATFTLGEVVENAGTTYWGGGAWPRIVVRSHGRLRDASRRPRHVEVVPLPALSPWEPPRTY